MLHNYWSLCHSWMTLSYTFFPIISKHVTVSRKKKFKLKYKLKYKILNNRKIIKNKSKELNELKLSDNLYSSESMCAGNHGLFSKCRELKKARKIFNTCFFNAIKVQLNPRGEIHKVFHTEDFATLLNVDYLDSFLINL